MRGVIFLFFIILFILPFILFSQSDYSELIKQGNAYFKKEDYQNAIKSYKSATEVNIYNYLAFYNLAYTYYKIKDYKKAKENIEIVLEGKPDLKKAIDLEKKIDDQLLKPKLDNEELMLGEETETETVENKSPPQEEAVIKKRIRSSPELKKEPKYTSFSQIEGIKETGELQLKGYYILPPSSISNSFIGNGLYLQYKYGTDNNYGFQLIDLYMSMDMGNGDIEDFNYSITKMGFNYLQIGMFYEIRHPVIKDIAGEVIKRQFGFIISANLLRYDMGMGMGMWANEEWFTLKHHTGQFGFSANALLSVPLAQFLILEGIFTYLSVKSSSTVQYGGDIIIAPFLNHPNYEIRLSMLINAIENKDSYTLLSLGLSYKWGPLYTETSITGDVK